MDQIEKEIVDLHQFFQDWMTGTIEQNRENFNRVTETIGKGFYLVTPSGELIQRMQILDSIYKGSRSRADFRMWIENTKIRHTLGDVTVATYEEWQEWTATAKITARLTTVVFTQSSNAVNGVLWQAVHETWLSRKEG